MQRKYIGLSFISFFIVVGLAGCRVGRDYKRPALVLPEQYNGSTSAPSDSSVAGLEWKRFFTDATLQELISRSLTGNYDLQLALKRIETAEAYVKQAKVA